MYAIPHHFTINYILQPLVKLNLNLISLLFFAVAIPSPAHRTYTPITNNATSSFVHRNRKASDVVKISIFYSTVIQSNTAQYSRFLAALFTRTIQILWLQTNKMEHQLKYIEKKKTVHCFWYKENLSLFLLVEVVQLKRVSSTFLEGGRMNTDQQIRGFYV